MKEQTRQVWKFILDREVEAPARFCAIQTHRASIAVMYQQASSRSPCNRALPCIMLCPMRTRKSKSAGSLRMPSQGW